jgi:hypothetical protein
MQVAQEGLVAKIADGIWIGNAEMSNNPVFLRVNDISAIIKLDRSVAVPADMDSFGYPLPDNELMPEEFPKTVTKLDSICEIISEMRGVGRNIIIQCADGKNKSALVAGYYLTRRLGQNPETVVSQLSTVYFSPEQVVEDREEKDRLLKIQSGEGVPNVTAVTAEDLKRQEVRRSRQALSNLSFRRIIRLKK